MRIAFINGGLSISETFIHQLIAGISQCNKETIFYTANKPFYSQGYKYKIVDFIYHPSVLIRKLSVLSFPFIKEYIWKKQQQKARKSLWNHLQDKDVIFVDYGTTGVALLPLLSKLKKKFIIHFHGFDITSALSDSFYKNELIKIFEEVEFMVAASHHIKRLLILEGAPAEKIEVIRYGIEIYSRSNLEIKRNNQKRKRIVFIGRLTPKKNPLALIQAFYLSHKVNNHIILEIIGDGPLFQSCIDRVNNLGITKHVIFHGALSHEQAMKSLSNADIYAQHSVTAITGDQEGFAISLAEAALLEIPVISTLHNGIPENVIDGETGFLVREFDFETMAERMTFLLNNPELAQRMGKKGREHILKLCSPDERIARIYNLLKKCSIAKGQL